jgi:hypothetical protein
MPSFTNKFNLPQYLVDWLTQDDYDHSTVPNMLSATTLMKPIRATIISSRHSSEIEVDVSDLIATKMGTAIHDSVEKVSTKDVTKEHRVWKLIEVDGVTFTVTGKYDLLVKESDDVWHLRDIKTTSVWAYIHGGKDLEYQRQLSIYRWILSGTYNVSLTGYIDFFFTDWQSFNASNDSSYPQKRIYPGYQVKLFPLEEIESYIRQRLSLFNNYRNTVDDDLPLCTREELWSTDEKFAIKKKDAKRATKLCDSREQAIEYMKDKNITGKIEHRPAKARRCKYCSASPYCNQYASLVQRNLIDSR